MPYRRSRRVRKPAVRRTRKYTRRTRRPRRMMAAPQPNLLRNNWGNSKPYITKILQDNNLISGTGANVSQIINFSALGIPGIASWNDIFDKFRINKIVAKFTLLRHEMTDDALMPRIYCRYNYDDSLLVTSIGSQAFWQTKRNVKVKCLTTQDCHLHYTFYPRVMAAGLLTTGGYTNMPRKPGWQDLEHNVQHYGFMYFIPSLATGQQVELDFEFHISFREQI